MKILKWKPSGAMKAWQISCALSAMVALSPVGAQTAQQAMFRGDPAHSGVYPTAGQGFGGLAWTLQTGGPVRSSAVEAGPMIVIGGSDGRLYACDKATGEPRWTTPLGSSIASSPAYADGLVFVATASGAFHGITAATGRVRWSSRAAADLSLAWEFSSGDFYTASPTIAGSLVIFGGGDGSVRAFDRADGTERWKFMTNGRVRSSPAVADGSVFVASFDGYLYSLDVATGAKRWAFATEGATLQSADFGFDRRSIQSSPSVVRGIVYFGSRDGHLYAVDARTGQVRWRATHDDFSWGITSPAVRNDTVFEGSSDARFYRALRAADGSEIWRTPASGAVWSSPALTGSLLIAGDASGAIHALDSRSGREIWRYQTGGPVHSSPVIVDSLVIVGSGDGAVYAIRLTSGESLRRAVFWDSASAAHSRRTDHVAIRQYLAGRRYESLDERALQQWMRARIADRVPSVVVFATDQLPSQVAGATPQTSLFRQYLDNGGKIVWVGDPPLIWPPDSAGDRTYSLINRRATSEILGVTHTLAQFDRYGAVVTDLGRRWGLAGWWMAPWSIDPRTDVQVLATDENGRAAAWVRNYGGRPGTGFVQLVRAAWTETDLEQLQRVAEFVPPGR